MEMNSSSSVLRVKHDEEQLKWSRMEIQLKLYKIAILLSIVQKSDNNVFRVDTMARAHVHGL